MDIQELQNDFASFIERFPDMSYQIAATVLVILGLWIIRFIAIRIINSKIDESKLQYKWRKNLTYTTGFIGVILIGSIWSEAFKSFSTFLGLVSAGLAIALRDPVTDFAAWIFLLWRKPFDLGDRIQLGDVKGDVIDIRIFKFTVLEIGNWVHADQSTGRVVHVPNHKVLTDSLANYTSDFEFIWNEIQVLITFESDWKAAKKILQEIADTHLHDFIQDAEEQIKHASKSYLIHYRYLTPIVYTNVKDSGINLTIRHLTNPRTRRKVGQAIWEDILDRFGENENIELAYPTMRITGYPD